MGTTKLLLAAALPLAVFYLFSRLRYARFQQFQKIPQLKPSLVWGHMKKFHELMTSDPRCPDRHVDMALSEMSEQLGNPPFMVLDLRPAARPMLVINSHEAAEQVSRASKIFPWSVPKSPTVKALVRLMGRRSILTKEGEEWKQTRKALNPGFAPKHLATLLPGILDKTWIFLRQLDSYAVSGEPFRLSQLFINLTFDIIGAVVMDLDLDAQHLDKADRGEMIRLYDELTHTYMDDRNGTTLLSSWKVVTREWRRYRLSSRIDELIKKTIREKHAEQRNPGSAPNNGARSVLALSLQEIDTLTEEHVHEACDTVKTFLFAGHDTTAILMAWIFYELARSPRILQTVRAELDDVLGPDSDPATVKDQLLKPGGDELLGRLSYVSAVIKETLRLHPPAGTARLAPPGSGFMLRNPQGEDVCVDGMVIYNCAAIIHRDRSVYGDTADDFVPERWLGDTDTSEKTNVEGVLDEKDGARKVPAGAWRPFERGPRNCIGQELANIEARAVVALAARRYDFVKIGLGECAVDGHGQRELDQKGRFKVDSELYSIMQVTSKPADEMRMRVKLVPGAAVRL